jgi:ferric-dicitrate binding protein FerR (iron transport regulator)
MIRPPDPNTSPDPEQETGGELVELPACREREPAADRLEGEPHEIRAWLQHAEDEPLAEHLAELARELAEAPQTAAPPAQAPRRWRPWVAAGLVAALAAAGLVLVIPPPQAPPPPSASVAQASAPLPPVIEPSSHSVAPPIAPPSKGAVQDWRRSLQSSDASRVHQIFDGVQVQLEGSLEIGGTRRAPRLHLVGSVEVDVVPGSVDTLYVDSNAALVQVLGTHFAVQEQVGGTLVSVQRGRVTVQCHTGLGGQLGAGHMIRCLDADGLYMQALQMRADGNDPAAVLPIVDKALSFPGSSIRERLEAMRAQLLEEQPALDEAP